MQAEAGPWHSPSTSSYCSQPWARECTGRLLASPALGPITRRRCGRRGPRTPRSVAIWMGARGDRRGAAGSSSTGLGPRAGAGHRARPPGQRVSGQSRRLPTGRSESGSLVSSVCCVRVSGPDPG